MASLLTEMPNVLDVREVWFTHLLLLGFDPAASEEKSKIHFSRYLQCTTETPQLVSFKQKQATMNYGIHDCNAKLWSPEVSCILVSGICLLSSIRRGWRSWCTFCFQDWTLIWPTRNSGTNNIRRQYPQNFKKISTYAGRLRAKCT